MNILIIGKFYTEGFALHIAETLKIMGHNVSRFEPGRNSGVFKGALGHRFEQINSNLYMLGDKLPAVRRRRMRRLWKIAKNNSVELVVVCHDFLWPEEVAELKRLTGTKVVMWFPDHLANFGRAYFMNAPYDALFFKDPYIKDILDDVLASPIYYLPECFNPDKHAISEGENIPKEYECDLTTAGNQHSYRVAFFKHLASYNVKLWGGVAPLWLDTGPVAKMYQGRPVLNEDKARAFKGAKIVINNLHFGEVWGVNVRAFEIAGIGGFQLIDWRPGLDQLFKDGEELVSFRNIDELHTKIKFYLANSTERMRIAENGKRRALSEHTYEHRLNLLIHTVFDKGNGFSMPKFKMLGNDQ